MARGWTWELLLHDDADRIYAAVRRVAAEHLEVTDADAERRTLVFWSTRPPRGRRTRLRARVHHREQGALLRVEVASWWARRRPSADRLIAEAAEVATLAHHLHPRPGTERGARMNAV